MLYRGRAPRQERLTIYVLPHMRQSWETMTSVSAGHIIQTPTQPVGSGRPQRESNPGPPLPQSYRAPRIRKLCLQMHLVVWVLSKKCLQMITESLLVYISQLHLEYMMVTNYLMT